MQHKVLILTTTETSNTFPENFSCWCAGALQAKGCHTVVETIMLEKESESSSKKSLEIQKIKLKTLQNTLLTAEKLVLILPEFNNMLPASFYTFMELLSKTKHYKTYKLVAIVMDPATNKGKHDANHVLFNCPLHTLDTLISSTVRAGYIQIKNNPNGDMCHLFREFYNSLHTLIQVILD